MSHVGAWSFPSFPRPPCQEPGEDGRGALCDLVALVVLASIWKGRDPPISSTHEPTTPADRGIVLGDISTHIEATARGVAATLI